MTQQKIMNEDRFEKLSVVEKEGVRCFRCENHFSKIEMREACGYGMICNDCFPEMYGPCDICGHVDIRDNLTRIENEKKDVCTVCRTIKYSLCDRCDQWVPDREMSTLLPPCNTEDRLHGFCVDCADEIDSEQKKPYWVKRHVEN